MMASLPLLSMIIFVPVVGSIVLLFVPPDRKRALYTVALGVSGLTFLLSLPLFFGISGKETGFSFVEAHEWIPAYGIRYHLGVDGISMLLVLLTTFLTPITILSSWRAIGRSVRRYLCCLLLLEGGMLGVFMALDLFVFYLFWEAMLIPMYLLIGIWGGERRIYAAIKFFLYTMVGSVLMLVAILYLAIAHQAQFGAMSFGLTDLIDLSLSPAVSIWLFAAFALAFAIKVPIFPFHTWLPDAHVEAPTGGSVILAGVLLKMGVYGFLRFAYPLFPGAAEAATPVIFTLAVIGIIYGALVAMVQRDIKKLVAYSSVSHLGFCMLGLFALTVQGMKGGILQLVNHGLSTGALFLLVGMIYERRHTRHIADFGGIARVMPLFAGLMLVVTFSSIGLPGTNGFIGEFLVILGTFGVSPLTAVLAAVGVILAAVYMLWMIERFLFGPLENPKNEKLTDLSLREIVVLAPIVVMIFWIGWYPATFLEKLDGPVEALMKYKATAVARQLPSGASARERGGERAPALEVYAPPSPSSTGVAR